MGSDKLAEKKIMVPFFSHLNDYCFSTMMQVAVVQALDNRLSHEGEMSSTSLRVVINRFFLLSFDVISMDMVAS